MTTKMKAAMKGILVLFVLVMGLTAFAVSTYAEDNTATEATIEESSSDNVVGTKAIAAAALIAVASAVGAGSMGLAISKSADGIARQPEAAGDIRSGMMLGLVFIETAIIYALIIAILIIFVL